MDVVPKEFVLVDRSILQKLGYSNKLRTKRDINGALKMDQNGNPIKMDNRIDFSNFYRFIRKRSDIFFEGTSFEDENATYTIQNCEHLHSVAQVSGRTSVCID